VLETMHLESINVGQAETISHGGKSYTSGIAKKPVAGPAYLGEAGVRGDVIVNAEHHGGPDQAIYAYSADDYDWWARETDREYPPGLFGENLTIRGLPSDMNVGDRLLIGEVVLEATAPRIPCGTFAARMQDAGMGLEFRQAEKPGVYLRVLNSGEVSPGDTVTFVDIESDTVSIVELFRSYYDLRHDQATLQRYLEAPLAVRFRHKIEKLLAEP
jgi:MOSC domain-containing protein YiiM